MNIENNKKGFTLVELLAVIVILSIIVVIAVPKVLDAIKNSRKSILESTVRVIASSAEKAMLQNKVSQKNEKITCESVAKMNDIDYENCEISFDEDIAKVTLKGSGRFKGLNVCDGTKIASTSTNEICPIKYGKGITYISKLLEEEKTLKNGLFVDDTVDKNIRYRGSIDNVKNKVFFNCKDEYIIDLKTIEYGDEAYVYEDNCEVWRIIGVFDTKSSDNPNEKSVPRIKIVRDEILSEKMSWDTDLDGIYANQWGETTLKSDNTTIYHGLV